MKQIAIYILVFSVFVACKPQDPEERREAERIEKARQKEMAKYRALQKQETKKGLHYGPDGRIVLPDACSLVDASTMSGIIGVPAGSIALKDGNPSGTDSRSCFFKWFDESWPNAGVLIQLMRNPVPDEVDEWPTYFIESKRTSGEQLMQEGAEVSFMFEEYTAFGDDGAYNKDIGKYFWRIGNEAVVMVAFNMSASPDAQMQMAQKIGTKIMNEL